jgi:hypothetical protein
MGKEGLISVLTIGQIDVFSGKTCVFDGELLVMWIRNKEFIGGQIEQSYSDPFCPKCGLKYDADVVDRG